MTLCRQTAFAGSWTLLREGGTRAAFPVHKTKCDPSEPKELSSCFKSSPRTLWKQINITIPCYSTLSQPLGHDQPRPSELSASWEWRSKFTRCLINSTEFISEEGHLQRHQLCTTWTFGEYLDGKQTVQRHISLNRNSSSDFPWGKNCQDQDIREVLGQQQVWEETILCLAQTLASPKSFLPVLRRKSHWAGRMRLPVVSWWWELGWPAHPPHLLLCQEEAGVKVLSCALLLRTLLIEEKGRRETERRCRDKMTHTKLSTHWLGHRHVLPLDNEEPPQENPSKWPSWGTAGTADCSIQHCRALALHKSLRRTQTSLILGLQAQNNCFGALIPEFFRIKNTPISQEVGMAGVGWVWSRG